MSKKPTAKARPYSDELCCEGAVYTIDPVQDIVRCGVCGRFFRPTLSADGNMDGYKLADEG